jgi:hypothetical protein
MKKELQDFETGVINGTKVVCRLIGNNPKIDPCRKCCISYFDCNQVACYPDERSDKMYVCFENVADNNEAKE